MTLTDSPTASYANPGAVALRREVLLGALGRVAGRCCLRLRVLGRRPSCVAATTAHTRRFRAFLFFAFVVFAATGG